MKVSYCSLHSENTMSLEATSTSLLKLLTPLITMIGKECASFIKDSKLKWESTAIVERLSKKVLDINTIKTMWSRDKGVLIDDFYFPSKVIAKYSRQEIDVLQSLSSSNIIIEGVVGQGKSILMRHTCNLLLNNGVIPVFIEMRMLSAERGLQELVLDYLDTCGIGGGASIFSYLAANGKIALVLDGFDEIPIELVKSAVFAIEQLRTKNNELRLIISSRPYHAAQNLQGFNVYALAELAKADYEVFLRKIVPESVDRFSVTAAISHAPESIKGIITTPLMLTLLVLVYKNEREIPSTLPIFFDKLFNTVFTGHDRLKAGFRRDHLTGLSESKIQTLFDAFCMTIMQLGGDRTISLYDFKKAFSIALKYAPDSKCEMEHFRKDIINTTCLMLEDGFDETTFLHKSIMEYHAASFIKNAPDSTACKFYKIAPSNMMNWETVLLFLSSIDSYRYGKSYVLEEYPQELGKITELLSTRSDSALIKYLNGMFPDLQVTMSNLRAASINSGITKHYPFTLEIQQLLSEIIFLSIEKSDSRTIQRAVRQSPQTANPGTITIGVRSIVENIDISSIWLGLSNVEQSMIEEVEKYRMLVDIEQSKCHIFDLF